MFVRPILNGWWCIYMCSSRLKVYILLPEFTVLKLIRPIMYLPVYIDRFLFHVGYTQTHNAFARTLIHCMILFADKFCRLYWMNILSAVLLQYCIRSAAGLGKYLSFFDNRLYCQFLNIAFTLLRFLRFTFFNKDDHAIQYYPWHTVATKLTAHDSSSNFHMHLYQTSIRVKNEQC